MTVVTTGQITIVDNNDARPITAYVTATPGPQQVYTKDESAVSYLPDWTTANTNTGILLTAKVYVGAPGGAIDVTGQLTNRQWSVDMATPLTGTNALVSSEPTLDTFFVSSGTFTTVHNASGSTIKIKANMMPTVAQATIYFEGDYTDPVTGLTSRVVAQITLGLVKTGTNAVYVITRGQTSIKQSSKNVKNVTAIRAELVRAAGIDTSGVTYRWFESNGATQIYNAAPFTNEYGLKTTTGNGVSGALAEIGSNLPTTGAWSTHNTLVIHENAVAEMGVYRVEAKDSDGTIYQAYFTVYDVSDPYDLIILSSSGDKLQNGQGFTVLAPKVYNRAVEVDDLTGWSFKWTFYNRNGKRGAFVDTTRTALAGGRNITANTTGVSATITYSGAAITFAAGDIIKAVQADGTEFFYEVASATGNVITIRTPTTNTWLNYTDFPAPTTTSQFTNGKLFVCVNSQGQKSTSNVGTLTLTGDEVDVKARIVCEADRP